MSVAAPTAGAVEANADGLVGPTHNFAGLARGNLAAAANAEQVSNPRAAALEGLVKMRRLHDLGVPQFVLPPHERPHMGFLRACGFGGSEATVLETAAAQAPHLLAAAGSASPMWAANAATVTASTDSADGRLRLTPANLLTNLHRSLEAAQTGRALRRLLPDERLFDVREPLPSHPTFADEGAANHVRLSAQPAGEAGVDLFVWSRDPAEAWTGVHPGRQSLSASQAVIRGHGVRRPVLARQSLAAIEAGAFHNDVVCVGAGPVLFFHEAAFADRSALERDVRAAAAGLFEPEFRMVAEAELSLRDAVSTYLFNSMLAATPGRDRLTLVAPIEVSENLRARAVAERLVAANGAVGHVDYVDVRQSMRNGGGPACLRLRLPLTAEELAGANPAQRFDADLHDRLSAWIEQHYRDRLTPADLADPDLLEESRRALEALGRLLALGSDFYPFQRLALGPSSSVPSAMAAKFR